MPLPLGHAAIGFAAREVFCKNDSIHSRWKVAIFVAVLANLPDLDVLIGLVFQGNGWAFHRGPTHSLFFALFMGFLASIAWKLGSQIPKMSFGSCSLLILSHVLADFCLGGSRVSLFWPFEVNWATGFIGWGGVMNPAFLEAFQDTGIIGWGGVMNSVFLEAFQDTGIIMLCGLVTALARLIRGYPDIVRTVTKALLPSAQYHFIVTTELFQHSGTSRNGGDN